MDQKDENVPPTSLNNDSLSSKVDDRATEIPRKNFTLSQRQELEKAFKKDLYPTVEERNALMLSTGLSSKQVKSWFARQRFHQQKNKEMVKSPSSLQVEQKVEPLELTKSVPEDKNFKNSNYLQQLSTLKNELDLEKIKSASLNEQLNDLRSQYDKLLFEKHKIARQLEDECSKNIQLNNKIKKLNNSNESFKKNLHAISVYVKKSPALKDCSL